MSSMVDCFRIQKGHIFNLPPNTRIQPLAVLAEDQSGKWDVVGEVKHICKGAAHADLNNVQIKVKEAGEGSWSIKCDKKRALKLVVDPSMKAEILKGSSDACTFEMTGTQDRYVRDFGAVEKLLRDNFNANQTTVPKQPWSGNFHLMVVTGVLMCKTIKLRRQHSTIRGATVDAALPDAAATGMKVGGGFTADSNQEVLLKWEAPEGDYFPSIFRARKYKFSYQGLPQKVELVQFDEAPPRTSEEDSSSKEAEVAERAAFETFFLSEDSEGPMWAQSGDNIILPSRVQMPKLADEPLTDVNDARREFMIVV